MKETKPDVSTNAGSTLRLSRQYLQILKRRGDLQAHLSLMLQFQQVPSIDLGLAQIGSRKKTFTQDLDTASGTKGRSLNTGETEK